MRCADCFEYYRTVADGQAYSEMLHGLSGFSDIIRLPRIGIKQADDVFRMVLLDHPELFYTDGFRYSPSGGGIAVLPSYSVSRKKADEIGASLKKRAERIVSSFGKGSDPVSEVHDYLVRTVTYKSEKRRYSHEIYGVLHHGIGVCEGISKTAKYLFDMLGVESAVIVSEPNGRISHAWNAVWKDGSPLHYDITFDMSHPSDERHYFGMTDSEIYRDHGKPKYPAPVCAES